MYKVVELIIISIVYLFVSWIYFWKIGNNGVNNFIDILSSIVMLVITIFFLKYLVKWIHKQLKL
jgi:hypothetical protein